MEYLAVFRPLFSFGAHVAAASRRGRSPTVDARSVFADLEDLIDKAIARRQPLDAENFDQAWFAVCAWLDEKLAALRREAGTSAPPLLQTRYFGTDKTGKDFFERLDALLEAAGDSPRNQARLAALEVYAASLSLEYRGQSGLFDDPVRPEDYRRRCRTAIGSTGSAALFHAFTPRTQSKKRRSISELPFWIMSIAVTIALYCTYRMLLSNLYSTIMGH